jgi:GxxExxY protein
MPVTVHATTRRLSQEEFTEIGYQVIGHVFKVNQEFGRYFDENIYHREIARRCDALNAQIKVPIEVCHCDFRKTYFADLLVGQGAIFELKTVDALNDRHRSQLLQYLMLADLPRGKLVNLRPESVQHEFVNTKLRHEDRTSFSIDGGDWDRSDAQLESFRDAIVSMLRELGTSLDMGLYEEILTHILGGENAVLQKVEVRSGDHVVDAHPVRVAFPGYSFNVTAVREDSLPRIEGHLRRFLAHTPLYGTHWINIRHRLVTFRTLHR